MELLRILRQRTHLGIFECKSALDEAQGDVEKAVEILQKRGSLKKADPLLVPREGIVKAAVYNGVGRIAELNCQTDFAAKSELFTSFMDKILKSDLDRKDLLDSYFTKREDGQFLCKQLGEKVVLKRYDLLWVDSLSAQVSPTLTHSICRSYSHHSGKIAVLIAAMVEEAHVANDKIVTFLDELAMQIAANKPLGLDRNAIAVQQAAEKQAELFKDQVKDKPAPMQERIVKGKMDKWMQEIVLLEQESIIHAKITITKLMENLRKEIGSEFVVTNFIRYELGE